MADDVFVRLGARIREVIRSEARSVAQAPVKFRAVDDDPVTLVALGDSDDVLEEGDEDFTVAHGLDIEKGDIVLVVTDDDGDYLAAAVVK